MIHVRGENPSRAAADFAGEFDQEIAESIRRQFEPRMTTDELTDVLNNEMLCKGSGGTGTQLRENVHGVPKENAEC
jgi:hypothetical protein